MRKEIIGLACLLAASGLADRSRAAPAPPATSAVQPTAATAQPARIETPSFWRADGQAFLARAQRPVSVKPFATNLILFIGDGMGLSTVTAARILQGQQRNLIEGAQRRRTGEENQLSFETFPATALSKTYTYDLQVAESAGAMSAIMTGVKTRGASVSMDQTPTRGQCREAAGHEAPTLLEQAKDAGLSAGLVATARITHAVPAATYAHVSDQNWETDSVMPERAKAEGCRDIARQLIEFDHHGRLDVVFGGGHLAFMGQTQPDPQENQRTGIRRDGRDLLAVWGAGRPDGRYLWSGAQFASIDWSGVAGPVLGLFAADHMAFESDRASSGVDEPSLTAMTKAAIAVLRRNPKGYVLVVDAGGIDRAHDAGNASRALAETVELANAVQAAIDATREADTLILVTADHSHTLTIGGYPRRGNPILGVVRGEGDAPAPDAQGKPYTTLTYANGLGQAQVRAEPKSVEEADTANPEYRQAAAVGLPAGTHGGEDAPVYARGPGAQWVHGTMEQSAIYWIMHAALKGLQSPRGERR